MLTHSASCCAQFFAFLFLAAGRRKSVRMPHQLKIDMDSTIVRIVIFANFYSYMKLLTIIIIATFWSLSTAAQTYEIGAFVGGSNFIGDVGSTNYIRPNKPVLGAILKWNRSPRHAFRFSALFTELEGDDSDSHENGRQERNLSFENSIIELSLGIEYTFWEFDMFKDRRANAPYLYTGITAFQHDNVILSAGELVRNGGMWDMAIPIVFGYKVALSYSATIALEGGIRYSFSDALDGSDPIGNNEGIRFGNLNNDDWYMFTGVTVSFAFGRKPCYCAF